METKSGGTAIILSFFWTGLGQLYAGRIGRGIAMMIITPVLIMIGWFGGMAGCLAASSKFAASASQIQDASSSTGVGIGGLIAMLIPVAWWIWGMVDAQRLCQAHNAAVKGWGR
jgi:hypothetical protein